MYIIIRSIIASLPPRLTTYLLFPRDSRKRPKERLGRLPNRGTVYRVAPYTVNKANGGPFDSPARQTEGLARPHDLLFLARPANHRASNERFCRGGRSFRIGRDDWPGL